VTLLDDKEFVDYLRGAISELPPEAGQRIYGGIDNWTIRMTLEFAVAIAEKRGSTESLLFFHTIHGFSPRDWVARFFREFGSELRRILCDKKSLSSLAKTAGYSAKAASTALAAWLMQVVGHPEPIAVGAAAVLMLILTEATHGAFCKMTDKEVDAALEGGTVRAKKTKERQK
jgi:hypothetical protein